MLAPYATMVLYFIIYSTPKLKVDLGTVKAREQGCATTYWFGICDLYRQVHSLTNLTTALQVMIKDDIV